MYEIYKGIVLIIAIHPNTPQFIATARQKGYSVFFKWQ